MKTDIQIPDFNVSDKIKLFFSTLLVTALTVLVLHVVSMSIYAFAYYDKSLVVSGFDFGEWSVMARCLILVPYLILPVVRASLMVAGFSLSNAIDTTITTIKSWRQADTQEDK